MCCRCHVHRRLFAAPWLPEDGWWPWCFRLQCFADQAQSAGPYTLCAAGALIGTPVLGALADAASSHWALAALVLLAGVVYTLFGFAAKEVAQLRSPKRDVELGVTTRGTGGNLLLPQVSALAADSGMLYQGAKSEQAASGGP